MKRTTTSSMSRFPQHRPASHDIARSEHGDTSSGASLPPPSASLLDFIDRLELPRRASTTSNLGEKTGDGRWGEVPATAVSVAQVLRPPAGATCHKTRGQEYRPAAELGP